MSNLPPTNPTSPGDPSPGVSVETPQAQPGFEESLQRFWEKNRVLIIGGCLLVALLIVGRSGWQWLQVRRAEAAAKEYAAATTDPQVQAFAASHPQQPLGGVAYLRLADEAFAAGKFTDARGHYERAREPLKDTPLAARVELGIAIATLKAGETAAGQAALQKLANDISAPKPLRTEAVYHLASLAAASNATDELNKLAEQVNAIDQNSLWAQRTMMLQRSLPASSAPSAGTTPTSGDAPAVSFPGK